MGAAGAVLRFIARSARRLAVTVVGLLLVLAGLVMLVTPGPGLLAIIAGLAILSTEYAWARRALDRARERSRQAVRRVGEARRARRRRPAPPVPDSDGPQRQSGQTPAQPEPDS